MRIFNDHEDVMNRSIIEVQGQILVVSQFTLLASTKKGNRPSYMRSANAETAKPLYDDFLEKLMEDFKSCQSNLEFLARTWK